MNAARPCPSCGKPLAADAPHGLCPECLLKAGLPSVPENASGTAAPPPTHRFTPPAPAELAKFFPALEIVSLVGQGGMGAVYKARQPGLDRLVALKILPPQLSAAPGFAERFTREARALARLSHPNIVAVHDFGQAGGFHYLLMEFVDGTNLRRLLETEKLRPHEALAIVPPICVALQYAHDRGIVHRDIKPENILLDRTGAVKIADFGLAKLVGTPDNLLTGAGDVMGTPHYMAPEQVEHPLAVDHRADIYSLGVVIYQMLTGELPLGRFAPPSRKVEVDVRLDEIVLRALEKEPALRYQQASALRTDVENVESTPPPVTPRNLADEMRRRVANVLGIADFVRRPETPAGSAVNATADGRLLVVPVGNPRFPLRCVKTNEPVTADDVRTRRFEWVPPIVYLSLLLTPIAFFICYYLFRQHVHLPTPLSRAGRRIVRRNEFIAAALLVGGVVLFVAAIAVWQDNLRSFSADVARLALVMGIGGLVAFIAGILHALLKGRALRLVKLQDGRAWFAGASPAFLDQLPAHRG